ncbi:HMOX1 [Auxenochlorella protothecoides x Auxenochlorella symbiontica]
MALSIGSQGGARHARRTPVQSRVKPCRKLHPITAHGHHGGSGSSVHAKPVADGSFLGELRQYAMRLHTREQAPREGKAAAPKPDKPWEPKLAGYMQFMAESKVVYDTFEELLAAGAQPYYKEFAATGLQRGAAIDHDLAYLSEKYGVPIPEAKPDGPGHTYASELRELAANKPGPFLCHFYNHYFAHTAGGRMIGKQVSQRILDGWTGNFYKWDGNVKVSGLSEVLSTIGAPVQRLLCGQLCGARIQRLGVSRCCSPTDYRTCWMT